MGVPSRNTPCPCGSGLKYKRCCLAAEYREGEVARFEDAVGKRISRWAAIQFSDELDVALEHFAGADRGLDDRDMVIFLTWFCSDRQLAGGGTPAERYAARAGLDERERDVARRIAEARLSLQRVRAVQEGRWIELEDVLSSVVVRVRSGEVSREAIRWDVLLCRVMADDMVPSLWGPALFYVPDEEPELLGELMRLARAHEIPADSDDQARIFRVAALELMRFMPASRCVERAFFTAEGDPIADGHARWTVTDAVAAFDQLDAPPQLAWVGEGEDGAGETFQWTVERAQAVERRPSLPKGAVCLESSLTDLPGRLCLATFTLTDGTLLCTAMSEVRLDRAIALVEVRLGALATLRERTVEPFERDLSPRRDAALKRREPPAGLTAAQARDLERQLVNDHFARWLDEPLEPLGGRTPRQAAHGDAGKELERRLRAVENRADRAQRAGIPWPDLDWLRDELGMGGGQLAA